MKPQRRLSATWPRLLVAMVALSATAAVPAPSRLAGPIPAGTWTGFMEDNISASGSASGVTFYANSEAKGNMTFTVDGEGNVTGVFGPYQWKMEWGTIQIEGKQECGSTTVADVSGKVTLNAAGLPEFSLTLKKRASESSSYCKPSIPGAGTQSIGSLRLEASTFSGGKMTGTKIEAGPMSAEQLMANLGSVADQINRYSYWELGSSSASVDLITPEYEQYFLEDITFQNTYTALINWNNNPPGTVHFSLAGQWQDIPGEAEVSATFNVGQVPAGTNPLQVTAITAGGETSSVLSHDVIIVPLEPWAEKAYFSVAEEVDAVPTNYVLYRGATQVPPQPLVLPYLDLSSIPVLGQFIGKWGVPPFQVDVNLEATSLGGLSNAAPVTGNGGFYLGGQKPAVKMTITGEAFTNMTPTALVFDHGQAKFKIDPASVSHDIGLVSLVPAVEEIFGESFITQAAKGILSVWKVTLQLTVSGTGQANLAVRPDQSELYFDAGSITPTVAMSVKPTLGIEGALWVVVSGTGKAKFTIDIAPQTGLSNCAVSLSAAAQVGFIKWSWTKKSPDYILTQCAQTAMGGKSVLAVALPPEVAGRLIELQAQDPPWSIVSPPAANPDETVLATGLAPQAEPALAIGPKGRLAFAFAPDETDGVSVRVFDGSAWGSPVHLSEAGDLGFGARIAFDSEGNAVVVWVRADDAFDETNLTGFARTWDIAYAVIQPDGAIAAKGTLAGDQVLDFGPHLAGAGENLWVAWVKSPGTTLWGPAEDPNELWAARWAGDGWGEPELVTDNLVGNLAFDVAAGDGQSALVLADGDIDSDPETAEDREVFAYQRETGGWESVRLSDNDVLDAFPLAALLSDGSPVAAWQQRGAAVAVEGNLRGEPQPLRLEPEGQHLDLAGGQLIAGPHGGLDLIWLDFTPSGMGVWRAHRPSSDAEWQPAQAVIDGTAQLGHAVGGLGEAGELWLGYSKLGYGAAVGEEAGAALPMSADMAVTSTGAAGAQPADDGDRPSGFNCLGLGAALPLLVAVSARWSRPRMTRRASGGGRPGVSPSVRRHRRRWIGEKDCGAGSGAQRR